MREDIVGLHIGDHRITAAQLRMGHRNVPRLIRAGWVDRDPGHGNGGVTAAILELWRKFHFRTSTVAVAIRSRGLIIRHFSYPFLTDNQLASTLSLEAEESTQLPPAELCLDWHVNNRQSSSRGDEGAGRIEGVFVAAPKESVQAEINALVMARLFPVVADVQGMAVANAFLTLNGPIQEDGSVCLLHLQENEADMVVFFAESGVYPRTIYAPHGGWHASIQHLLECLEEGLHYVRFKLHKPGIKRFLVAGRANCRDEIVAALSDRFAIEVTCWDPLDHMRVSIMCAAHRRRRPYPGIGNTLIPAIGLAMRF